VLKGNAKNSWSEEDEWARGSRYRISKVTRRSSQIGLRLLI
jgi:hypothetical protein